MIKTLHWYLSRELVRITCLALVALTLLMTVFGIIEPMRKVGLSSDQVLALFGYLVPVMLSLTLPVAALFAGTIVYGRFSQDNELMACRASGVSTISLLKPALVLGGVVTVMALALNNFVAPRMLGGAERAVKNNIAGVIFPQFRRMNYIQWGAWLIHADYADPQTGELHGVIAVRRRERGNMRLVIASTGQVSFGSHEGETYATVYGYNPVVGRSEEYSLSQESFQPFQQVLPSPAKEKPSWYDWGRLVATLRDPADNREINEEWTGIKRRICHDMFAREVGNVINAGGSYDKLRQGDRVYLLNAAGAEAAGEVLKLYAGMVDGGKPRPVELKILRDNVVEEIVTADSGRVEAEWSILSACSFVTIRLLDNVLVRRPGQEDRLMRTEWTRAELPVPEHVQRRAGAVTLQDVWSPANRLNLGQAVLDEIEGLKSGEIKKLLAKVKAEMHGRVAYGVSCFLMVALGSALGLIFRGGHFISAFAIAMVPGAVVIMMMIMGKEILRNPDVMHHEIYGLACIWSGIAILGVACVLVYLHLMRK